ncbi:hypothetical protein J0X19_04905 [Hymenobacter sp. BT186]|uniref:Outer membrane protein beta-barrel domain-containing protein n=1 Tax=Hymenobacter telluris TaxID=2816474 RepID=A0A939EUA4_9BACT|nr:hypothetical protein [Hymenobacter telluris]MBO0357274.1 hypothetical protein [Hymenobacter telluris]MBW3373300.1 hypothetical protein [Hymenobacter norwichensis]
MPTPDMSDEELDELVRRSAEAYPEEIPLGNWLRMEDKLRKAATERLVRQRIWRFFGLEVAIVALLVLLWQGYRAVNPTTEVAPRITNSALADATSQANSAPATFNQPQPRAAAPGKAPLATASSAPGVAASTSVAALTRPAQPTGSTTTLPLVAEPKAAFPGHRAAILALKRRPIITAATKRRYAPVGNRAELQPTGLTVENPTSASVLAATPLTQAPPPTTEWALLESQPLDLAQHFKRPLVLPLLRQDSLTLVTSAPTTTDSIVNQQDTPAVPFYRVVVGVIGAPAWSAVRTLNTAQLGGNLGLTLEYRLTPRLRVRSGLVRSVKRYAAASSDYTPQPAWNWRPGTYEVYANCRITEIPLDLRYDVVRQPTYTVFASTGFTSLLMRHERYAYDYQVNGQNRTAAAQVVNGSNYAFGLFTASAGLERPFGSRWSGQVEPFLQLPLGSVGAGKVRLSSAGVSFSIKYGLLR